MQHKVTVVGAGHVGATTALRLVQKELADVALVDIIEGMPQGKSLDLLQAGPIEGYDCQLVGSNDYDVAEGSDLVIITAGLPRKPGMSRDDLLLKNAGIVTDVTEKVSRRSPEAIIIVVSNPLDAMCQIAKHVSGFPRERVLGMAGILDSARFRTFIAQELKVSVENIHTFVLGGHGDTMIPLARYSTVAGVPVTELIPPARLQALIERTRDGGAEIVKLLKAGSAYYAPSSAIAEMVEAILKDKKKLLPCAAYLQGEYGIHDLYVGVPAKLGRAGMEEIFQIQLTSEEQSQLEKSTSAIQELVKVLTQNGYL